MIDRETVEHVLEGHGYRLMETLGRGSFGFVSRVESTKYPGISFVVKMMQVRGEAARETENLQGLSHPNIIRMYDFFLEGDVLYIIFEYCPGGSLAEVVRTRGPLTGHTLYSYTAQIIAALISCHEHKIAHQDIKPDNILIDEHNRPRLADFGMSCRVKGEVGDDSLTGSRAYMAPEVLTRQKRMPWLADVWSLGVTLFVISAGYFPWPVDNVLAFMNSVREAKLNFPSFVDPTFAGVVQDMVRVTPTKRIDLKKALEIVTNLDKSTFVAKVTIRPSESLIRVPFRNKFGKLYKSVPMTAARKNLITGYGSSLKIGAHDPLILTGRSQPRS